MIALTGFVSLVFHADEPRSWKSWPEYLCLPVLMVSDHVNWGEVPPDPWLAVWLSCEIFLGAVLWTRLLLVLMEAGYRRGNARAAVVIALAVSAGVAGEPKPPAKTP